MPWPGSFENETFQVKLLERIDCIWIAEHIIFLLLDADSNNQKTEVSGGGQRKAEAEETLRSNDSSKLP